MAEIYLQIDPAQLADLTARLDPKNVPKAIASGANRTAEQVRTRVVRRLAGVVALKQAQIRRRIFIQRASATGNSQTAIVKIGKARFGIMKNFTVAKTTGGVAVGFAPGGLHVIAHSFIATMPSGHVGVFLRDPGAEHRTVQSKKTGKWVRTGPALGIQQQWGPSLSEAATMAPGFIAQETAAAGELLKKNLDSQINRFLARQAEQEAET
jgi:hypothetical protein